MYVLGIGTNELLGIMLSAAIVLGPERLARSAREIGKLVRNEKAYMSSFSDELKTEMDLLDGLKKIKDDVVKR